MPDYKPFGRDNQVGVGDELTEGKKPLVLSTRGLGEGNLRNTRILFLEIGKDAVPNEIEVLLHFVFAGDDPHMSGEQVFDIKI